MKKVTVKKIIIAILMAIYLLVTFENIVFATSSVNYDVDAFNDKGSSSVGTSIQNTLGAALYIVKIIAVGVGLIMLAVLAMKYMFASAENKASIKQSAVVYVVGAVVFFGAAGILNIIQSFVNSSFNSK
jgi:type IV secretory pathway VirB2 component (pilin)